MHEKIRNIFSSYSIDISDDQIEKFKIYYEFLVEYNKNVNLTAITNFDEVIVKHFIDSIMVLKYVDIGKSSLVDIGSGAGFPGIPLKIMRDDIDLSIVDSLEKRLVFINKLAEKLGITVDTYHKRAEDLDDCMRESFDFATARAVAPLNILSELCIPYIKPGGKFIALKSKEAKEELIKASCAIETLGGTVQENYDYKLGIYGARNIIVIDKIRNTAPLYPRNSKKIKKNPL